ncbi:MULTISPECIES: hypothetical protein [Nostocales]|uniref:DUF697 domain-containing protein n=2 Tax=Tolypothrix TaxID=111782 RepID=A0A0C1QWQ3_9CYAN
MTQYCRDRAREELSLMMGGGAATGVAGTIPVVGAVVFGTSFTVIQATVIYRIAQIYDVDITDMDIIDPGKWGPGSGAIMAAIVGTIAGFIPGVGVLVQPAVGAATVKAFGEAAIAYFENIYPNKIYVKK